VDWLADDVVDAAFEQAQRVVERVLLAQRDDRGAGAVADLPGRDGALAAVADEKCADRAQIGVGRRVHPLPELAGREACAGYALTVEK
jgi:hypothetical protein